MRCKPWLYPLLAALSLTAHASPTQEFTLANGLKVVVREDHRAPVAVTQVWYRIGSSYEPPGKTGMSHALEHMMFKGTEKVPSGEFSRLVAWFGGSDNAFTTDDYTAYYQVYSSNRVPLALELEADRMVNLKMNPDAFAQEIRVVMEERRQRTEDNPQSQALERFQAMALFTTPHRTPTIGWMQDLQSMKVEDLTAWYRLWYAPNNATLVVVGDVDPQQIKAQAEQYFGAIPAQNTPVIPAPREIPQPGQREMQLSLPAKVPALYMGFNVPSLTTAAAPKDAYALRMLLSILDGGLSARLESRLVRTQRSLTAISSSYNMMARGDTLFTLTAIPSEGVTLEQARQKILDELEALKTESISNEELERVYTGILAENVFRQDDIQEQANLIGMLESIGLGWKTMDNLADNLKAVTPDDIRDAAKRWLTSANMTSLLLKPADLTVGEAR
ncbi:zinc protease [Fluviicoccus keumensis]|uniref:Zinc protease n=1 Tax=Fluviicoccus keumensis TaxID=1435465 RepID=A0A4Q7ZA30_9GAMM|nr:pitrilysin family protein [Fluviicoccus keumensis]RZU46934.1 zinc protease [Fluviicoccus keumensis]